MRSSLLLVGFLSLCSFPLAAFAVDDKAGKDDPAAALVEQAEKAFAENKLADAERHWRLICERHAASPQYGLAQFNLAYTLQKQGKIDDAILEYQKLLRSKVNDKDPGANLMEAYRNYRNKAAKQISVCYESQGLHRAALDWAIQGRDKFPYGSWCGTCMMQEKEVTNSNIARLQRLVDEASKR